MKRRRNLGQKRLVDPWETLHPPIRRRLERGWPGLFREELLPGLPVELLAGRYAKERRGRPGKDLYTLIGMALLQQVFDLTDAETVDALAGNLFWHFALDLPNGADSGAAYVCERVLWDVRRHLTTACEDAGGDIFSALTGRLIEHLGVDTAQQRIDGTHVQSNMARLNRVRILFRALRSFLRDLRRDDPGLFQRDIPLSAEWVARILEPSNDGAFGQVKPSESRHRLQELGEMAATVEALFAEHATVGKSASFLLLARVLHEQCEVTFSEETDELIVVERPAKEISSGSTQNPSDPDATYSGHKGQGYTAQIVETFTEAKDDTDAEADGDDASAAAVPPPNLAMHVELHPANEAEGKALEPAIDAGLAGPHPVAEMLADTAYGSDANAKMCADAGVELVAPVPGDAHPTAANASNGGDSSANDAEGIQPLTLADFTLSEPIGTGSDATPRIKQCPAGHAPIARKALNDGGESVTFDGAICATCPFRDRCPTRPRRSPKVKRDGRNARKGVRNRKGQRQPKRQSSITRTAREASPHRDFRATGKSLRLTRRRQNQRSDAFRDRYRYRSGVESLNSAMKRRFGAGRVRYRRFHRVRFAIKLRVLGLNLMRAAAHRAAAKARHSGIPGPSPKSSSRQDHPNPQDSHPPLRALPIPTNRPQHSIPPDVFPPPPPPSRLTKDFLRGRQY